MNPEPSQDIQQSDVQVMRASVSKWAQNLDLIEGTEIRIHHKAAGRAQQLDRLGESHDTPIGNPVGTYPQKQRLLWGPPTSDSVSLPPES